MNPETAPSLPPNPPRRRWRWLKRLGWCVVWLITLAVLATLVENRLGARAWREAQEEARAAGEPIDPAQIIPPPAADADNFAAIPLFAPLFDYDPPSGELTVKSTVTWRNPEAKTRLENRKLPSLNQSASFRRSEFVDLAAWKSALKAPEEAGTPAAAVLSALREYDPELNALREAAKRPRSRFPIRYQDHVAAVLPHIGVLMNFSRIVSLKAVAELAEGNAEAAHADVLLGLALEEAPREEPLLISPLVRIAVLESVLQPVWEGLARRQWSDAQLASLDAALQRPDFVATFHSAIRGERLIFCSQALDAIKRDPSMLTVIAAVGESTSPRWPARLTGALIPSGWIDFNKAAISRRYSDVMRMADPAAHQFFPQQLSQVDEAVVRERKEHLYNPRRVLVGVLFPSVTSTSVRFASAQSSLDLARTAIALERYRLAHGALPASLTALGPLPADVIGGAPLHYRVGENGAFTLYSIGWNQSDDHGAPAWTSGTSRSVEWKKGDWLWPAYPAQEIGQ